MKQTLFSILILFTLSTRAHASTPTNPPPPKPGGISIQEMLINGPPQLKMHSLAMLTQGTTKAAVDEHYLPGLIACAKDKDPLLRSTSARIMGEHFVEGKENPNSAVLALLTTLASDESDDVRFSAIYYGLTQVEYKSPELVDQLIDIASIHREGNLMDRIIVSLANYRPQVIEILDTKLAEDDNIAIFEIYEDLTGKKPENADKYLDMPSSRPRMLIISSEDNNADSSKSKLETALKAAGMANPDVRISGDAANYALMLKTYIMRDYQTAEALLSKHSTFKLTQEMWLTPELEIQIEAMRKAQ